MKDTVIGEYQHEHSHIPDSQRSKIDTFLLILLPLLLIVGSWGGYKWLQGESATQSIISPAPRYIGENPNSTNNGAQVGIGGGPGPANACYEKNR